MNYNLFTENDFDFFEFSGFEKFNYHNFNYILTL